MHLRGQSSVGVICMARIFSLLTKGCNNPQLTELFATDLPDAAAVEKYLSNYEHLHGQEETVKMIEERLHPRAASQESLLAGVHSQSTLAGLHQVRALGM